MDTVRVQSFFDKRYNTIEIADATTRYMARRNNFHAVELPHVEVMDVLDTVNELHLLKQCVRVNILGNKLHDNFGDANQLRDSGVCDDHDDEE